MTFKFILCNLLFRLLWLCVLVASTCACKSSGTIENQEVKTYLALGDSYTIG